MKSSECDFVVLGTIIRETIGTIGEARKTGFNPTFLGSSAAYTDLIHKLGGKPMDGPATMTVQHPYLDEASQPIRFLGQQVQDQVQRRPRSSQAHFWATTRSMPSSRQPRRQAPNLSTDSLPLAMDTMVIPPDMFGSAEATFGPQKRSGQRPVAPVADPGWQVESGVRLRQAMSA